MVVRHDVTGYENFCKFIENLKTNGEYVHIYFSGSALPSGKSWCPDCVAASPLVEKALTKADANSHFVYVEVGDRPTWKDKNCPFRTDPRLRLLVIPTLIRWNNPQRLAGDQCCKQDLVDMLITDDE